MFIMAAAAAAEKELAAYMGQWALAEMVAEEMVGMVLRKEPQVLLVSEVAVAEIRKPSAMTAALA
jgi:hypothetical protein